MAKAKEPGKPSSTLESAGHPGIQCEGRRRALRNLAMVGAATPAIVTLLYSESAAAAYCTERTCCW
jgi:hypothetical protein